MKIFGFQFGKIKNEAPASQPKKKKRIYSSIKKQRTYRTDLEMDELGKAIEAAKDPDRPNRDGLYSIYSQIQKDRHLKSQVETAINDVQQSAFMVEVDGKENEDLRALFDAEWFDDSVEYIADAENWGHSLIEYPEINERGEFDACFLIPRENIDPAKGEIILDRFSDSRMPYRDNLQELNLIEIEGKEELGIYEYAAEEVILKKYARTDWSQASERYGMPFLDYATDVEDAKELDKIEEMCANFAANGYIVRGKEDVVEIKEPKSGDFYKIYMEAIAFSNQELSKLINGQTATAESQAFVGTAEVHERIKNVFTKARLRRVQNHINGKLIPLMVKNGYEKAELLAKAKLRYKDLMEDDETLNTEAPPSTNSGDGGQGKGAANMKRSAAGERIEPKKKSVPWS